MNNSTDEPNYLSDDWSSSSVSEDINDSFFGDNNDGNDGGIFENTAHESKEGDRGLGQANIIKIKNWLEEIKINVNKISSLLEDQSIESSFLEKNQSGVIQAIESTEKDEGNIIEGVFDGQVMIGPDGKQYSVPANYASKSKLVEGDILKLTITPRGSFIYKQINPVERDRLVGRLHKNEETDDFYAMADGKKYKLLTASITYFKGGDGDEVVILVPKDEVSSWAAVENVIKM